MSFRVPNARRVTVPLSNKMITKQSYKKESDINNIMNQFKKTGIITHISTAQADYADLPDQLDYQQSIAVVMAADEAFDQLPSVVRRYFDNDPAKLLLALGDDAMRPKLEELGVLNPQPQPRPPGNPSSILPSQNPPTLDPA